MNAPFAVDSGKTLLRLAVSGTIHSDDLSIPIA